MMIYISRKDILYFDAERRGKYQLPQSTIYQNGSPVWLIAGSCSGFGLLLSLRALQAGHRVIATVRDPVRSAEAVKSIEEAGGRIIQLDMAESKASITEKIQEAERIFGKIDHLVNNAGHAVLGVIELFT